MFLRLVLRGGTRRRNAGRDAGVAAPPVSRRFNADLVGHVVDSMYGKPVAGADVIVRRAHDRRRRATTDQFGSWRFTISRPAAIPFWSG